MIRPPAEHLLPFIAMSTTSTPAHTGGPTVRVVSRFGKKPSRYVCPALNVLKSSLTIFVLETITRRLLQSWSVPPSNHSSCIKACCASTPISSAPPSKDLLEKLANAEWSYLTKTSTLSRHFRSGSTRNHYATLKILKTSLDPRDCLRFRLSLISGSSATNTKFPFSKTAPSMPWHRRIAKSMFSLA